MKYHLGGHMRLQDEIQDEETGLNQQTRQWGQSFKFKSDGGEDYQIYQAIILGLYRSVFHTDRLAITVSDGVVYLSGELESEHACKRINEFIGQVRGVKDVKSRVHIS